MEQIDKITNVNPAIRVENARKNISRTFFDNISVIVPILIFVVAVCVYLTRIEFITYAQLKGAISDCIFIFICSYSEFLNMIPNGVRVGKESEEYKTAEAKNIEYHQKIKDDKTIDKLPSFCKEYVENELKETRVNILSEANIDYDFYVKNYLGKPKSSLKEMNLGKQEIRVILTANKVKPLILTPSMIYRQGKFNTKREAMSANPRAVRTKKEITGILRIAVTSFFAGALLVDLIEKPTFASFVLCLVKLFPLILNASRGFRCGYDNIVIYTTNYINCQNALIEEFFRYTEKEAC